VGKQHAKRTVWRPPGLVDAELRGGQDAAAPERERRARRWRHGEALLEPGCHAAPAGIIPYSQPAAQNAAWRCAITEENGSPRRAAELGQGLIEYALIIFLVAIVVIAILLLLGPQIGAVFSQIYATI
jgi:Flp pilus assembly pilin Flp